MKAMIGCGVKILNPNASAFRETLGMVFAAQKSVSRLNGVEREAPTLPRGNGPPAVRPPRREEVPL